MKSANCIHCGRETKPHEVWCQKCDNDSRVQSMYPSDNNPSKTTEHTTYIHLPQSTIKDINRILKRKAPESDSGNIIDSFTARFDNGMEVDIQVVNGDGPYVNPVLFDKGFEVDFDEPCWIIEGEYKFEYLGSTYKVIVGEQQ